MVFDAIGDRGHEQVSHFSDPETGLQAIVAIHDTTLGPGLGGTRIYDYETEADALEDVLRLSRAMTYKAAAADLDLGGAKAVVIGDPTEIKTDALLEAYGRAVERLGGRYITSVDVNSTVADMDVVARKTDHVVGTSAGIDDPSTVTAHGVRCGIEACIEHTRGTDDIDDISVLVQGLGKVGRSLAVDLHERGASVTVSDIDADAVAAFEAEYDVASVSPEGVYDEPCDVFAPCAVGGVIADETIDRLQCDVVAGAANNVLDERRHAVELSERGILYAPDYVINAGGLIAVYQEKIDGSHAAAIDQATAIGPRLLEMIERADTEGTTVLDAAEHYAEERLHRDERTTSPAPGT